jgi:uncharacterized protein (TIGR02118 family)
MVKLVVCFKRRADMEVEPFQEYWRTRHAEVVCGLPGIRRYAQSHTLLAGYRKGEPVHDGIAEVWFDDTDAIRALDGTDMLRAVQEDEAKFIDRSTMKTLVTDEHLVKDGDLPDGCVKNIEFVHRRPGLGVDEFQRCWRDVHGPLASEIPMVLRYVQSHCRRGGYAKGRQPPCDGIAIMWFESTGAMRESARTDAYARTCAVSPDFVAPGDLPFIITREHVVIP